MRDDTAKWPVPTDGPMGDLIHNGITISHLPAIKQTLISGPRSAAVEFGQVEVTNAWPDVTNGDHYAVSLRRDRILLVGSAVETYGWIDRPGLAVSDMTSGYAVINLTGARAFEVLRTGTELALETPSASALRLWNGYGAILYWHGNGFRLHVDSGSLEGVWEMLDRQSKLVTAHHRKAGAHG